MRTRRPSAQTVRVLDRLAAEPGRWWHGYELSRLTGVASGTLYPMLMRLAERGHLASEWQESVAGRPARHLYRITPAGEAVAAATSRATPRFSPRAVGQGA